MPRKVSELNELYPTDCSVQLQVRADYAHWNYETLTGYIRYQLGDNNQKYEHRLVAQYAYGDIPPGYHVHHIPPAPGVPANILDNRAARLEVLSNSEHQHRHNPPKLQERRCFTCNRVCMVEPHQVRRNKRFFCDQICRAQGDRKVKRPNPAELYQLMLKVNNWSALGEMFGVSDNAVRKWAKNYGLDLSMCNGRQKNLVPPEVVETSSRP